MTTYALPRFDMYGSRTVDSPERFAEVFGRWPFTVVRGVCFEPLFYGPSEQPSYRRKVLAHGGRGVIVQAWPDKTPFANTRDRDRAALADATAVCRSQTGQKNSAAVSNHSGTSKKQQESHSRTI